MLSNILTVISLGHKLIGTIADFRRDMQAARPSDATKNVHTGRLEALEGRLGDLESQAKEQDARVADLERSLQDALRATEALAERVSAIFWIASVAFGLTLIGLIASVVALTRAVR